MTRETKTSWIIATILAATGMVTPPLLATPITEILVLREYKDLTFYESDLGLAPGSVSAISQAPLHGTLTFDSSAFQFTPEQSFWTVGGDRFELTLVGLANASSSVVTLTAASNGDEVFKTSFEPGDAMPFPRVTGSTLDIGPEGAVVFENGVLLQAGPNAPNRAGGYDWTDMAFSPACVPGDLGCLGRGNGGSGEIHVTLEDPPPPFTAFPPSYVTILTAVDSDGTPVADLQLSFDGHQAATLRAMLHVADGADIYVTGGPNPVTIATGDVHRLRLDVWTGNAGGLLASLNDRAVLSLQDQAIPGLIEGFDIGLLDGVSPNPFSLRVDHLKASTNGEAADGEPKVNDSFLGGLGSWTEVWEVAGPVTTDGNLDVTITDSSAWASFLRDSSPSDARNYRARFQMDTDLLTLPTTGQAFMLIGYPDEPVANNHFQVRLRRENNDFQIRVDAKDDAGTVYATAWHPLTRGEHIIETQWRAATAVGTADGYVRLFVDGQFLDEALFIPNAGRVIGTVRFGLLGVDAGTGGTISYDDFVSWTDTPEQREN